MKASELAKARHHAPDAYNSLEQEMGIVTATADRPMQFSSLRVDEAVHHIIETRRAQLDRLQEGYDALSEGTSDEAPSAIRRGG